MSLQPARQEALTRVLVEFIEGKREYVRFRGKREGANPQRPVLEIRPVAGLEYIYVVLSMSHNYIVLLPETHELELEVAAAIDGPIRLVHNELPVRFRRLEAQPVLVRDERRADAVWYQTERYVYLCVIPGPGPLAGRLSVYDSWSSPTGRPESIDIGGIPSPAMLDYYTRGILELEADAPTMPG